MTTFLFVISAVCVINYSLSFSNTIPVPILHIWGITFGNCYISTPALCYQVYFWYTYLMFN